MAKGKYYSLKYKPATGDKPESRLYWRNHMESIEQLHCLLDKDVIFLSLDFEATTTSGPQNQIRLQQIGISTFDTRDMASGDYIDANVVKPRHICTQTRDVQSKGQKFLFGKSEHVRYRDIMEFLGKMFHIEDSQNTQKSCGGSTNTVKDKQYRNIVLLAHGGHSDLSILKRIGFDIQDILPIIAVIDTEKIGQAVFKTPKCPSLATLLDRLGCPWGLLHNAGNDAMFTMNALLALAIKSRWQGTQSQLIQLHRIAYAPIPDVEEILRKNLQRKVASQRALNKRVRNNDEDKDWTEMLEYGIQLDGD